MAGVALVTLAGVSWLFLLPLHLRGRVDNPYIGLLVFIAVPIAFFAGLALIPLGIAVARRRGWDPASAVPDRRAGLRRAGLFFGVTTLANIVIGSQLTYRAVEHMETLQFCGQSCHVMQPEFTAHSQPPHQQVACVGCHVEPGATGWLKAKTAGTRQLLAVVLNNFSRPIESAIESNRLAPSADTCEQCHAREKVVGPRLRILTKFRDDQKNTRTETVLTMKVGGGRHGGIHGTHMAPGVHIRYAAQDKKRQIIPWVEYQNSETGATRTYLAADAKAASTATLAVFDMQCVDCHNRPAHAFETPERAVDQAMAQGLIPAALPFVKKTSVALLQAPYGSDEEAARKIPATLAQTYPGPAREAAGRALVSIYLRNVFPDLKVTWGTYPNNLGHTDAPGCFRCHDNDHATADKKTITQDCAACHEAVAVEEESPGILKTLGVQ
jgi:hypothetical protein